MIKEIKKNQLRWIMPYDLKDYATDENALNLVNSEDRKLIINNYVVVSTNKKDLEYIYDLFINENVRIKIGFINSVKFYGIEYATNYNKTLRLAQYEKNEKLKTIYNNNFIKFEDLILGKKTIEDIKNVNQLINKIQEKRYSRIASRNNKINNLTEIKKIALKKYVNNILSKYNTITTTSGTSLYIYNDVAHTKYELLKLNHSSIYNIIY